MIAHLSFVVCDRCGGESPPMPTGSMARQCATQIGWERRTRNSRIKDLCPECKKPRRRMT